MYYLILILSLIGKISKKSNKTSLKKKVSLVFVNSPSIIKFYLILAPLILGICTSIYGSDIRCSILLFKENLSFQISSLKIHWEVLLYLSAVTDYIALLIFKIFNDEKNEKCKQRIVSFLENDFIYLKSDKIHKNNLRLALIASKNKQENEYEIRKNIVTMLNNIVEMVNYYISYNIKVTANVMLMISTHESKSEIKDIFCNKMLFYETGCLNTIDGVLYLVPGLHSKYLSEEQDYNSIALPVILNKDKVHYSNLLGAPLAASDGESYIKDTKVVETKTDSDKEQILYNSKRILKYFNELNIFNLKCNNKSKDRLRSIYSYRLSVEGRPFGVINLNFNQPNVFTHKELRYVKSLIVPLIDCLIIQLKIFAIKFEDKTIKSLNLLSEEKINNSCMNCK